jgi:group I intron endonuclease
MNTDTGVYAIISPSGKQYIGSAVSFKRRWRRHRNDLRNGSHVNKKLQNAWNKYGEENFHFVKIALCSIPDLLPIEQRLIRLMEPAYNVCEVAGSTLGFVHSRESREKMASVIRMRGPQHHNFGVTRSDTQRAHLSRLNQGGKNPRARSVMCFQTGSVFPTGKEAAKWLRANGYPKASDDCVTRACNGARKSACGYTWRYTE